MIGILGGGAWGSALAHIVAQGGEAALLWAREPDVVQAINSDHANPVFLPGVILDRRLQATSDMARLEQADLWLVVSPAQYVRATLAAAPLAKRPTLVLCAKGIEADSLALMADIAAQIAPDCPVAVLSGPTFAGEVARGLPTAITLACTDAAIGTALIQRLARPSFRPYLTDDVIGAEIGGAVKNVLAIACGVVVGRELGENARAAVISRGFAEMLRFGLARGARAETLAGLSGLGDLVLTCGSAQSRNMSLGIELGRGTPAADLLANRKTVAEGAATAPVLLAAAKAAGVDMPICEGVAALLNGAPADAVIDALLRRPLRSESQNWLP